MAVRHLIGPNGARFTESEPLPGWIEKRLAAGEIRDDPDAGSKPKPAAKPAAKKTTAANE